MKVAVAVLNFNGQVLIAKRQAHQHLAGLWEFPGGKVESGETCIQALVREVQEELGVETQATQYFPLITLPFNNSGNKHVLEVFWAEINFQQFTQACGNEGQEIRWVSFTELPEFEFPEINQDIIVALKGFNDQQVRAESKQ